MRARRGEIISGADVPYRVAVPVVWVGWSTPPNDLGAAAAVAAVAAEPTDTSRPAHSEAAIAILLCLCLFIGMVSPLMGVVASLPGLVF